MHIGHLYIFSREVSGEGNGTPLQYSCLENSMDSGAWWATVHGVSDPGGFPTQDTDGLWSQPGTDGPQTEPRTDCLLGEPNQDDSLEEPEHRELVTHLYSHLEGSTLTPVPRLIITPETPEPEARPGGPPSQLEAGSGAKKKGLAKRKEWGSSLRGKGAVRMGGRKVEIRL